MRIEWDKIEWGRCDDEDKWHSYLTVEGVLLVSGFLDPGPAQVFKAHLAKKIRERIESLLNDYHETLSFLNVSRPDPKIKEWTVEIHITAGWLGTDDAQAGEAVLRRRLEGKKESLRALLSLQTLGDGIELPKYHPHLKWEWSKERARPPGVVG